jgi:ADP-heptose:LPS heptosyltransferase
MTQPALNVPFSFDDACWINPVGGLGDALMLSGVLKLVKDANPGVRHRCVRRSNYLHILSGHPAIELFGFPPPDARILTTDYWSHEKLGPGNQRAFQILARKFGLVTPVEEQLYLPLPSGPKADLVSCIPWGKINVIIAPASDSPRKMMPDSIWEKIAGALKKRGASVFQVGKTGERHINGTYSLIGLSSPRQLIDLVGRADAVVTVDNFVMHAAHLKKVFTVAVWANGPKSLRLQ